MRLQNLGRKGFITSILIGTLFGVTSTFAQSCPITLNTGSRIGAEPSTSGQISTFRFVINKTQISGISGISLREQLPSWFSYQSHNLVGSSPTNILSASSSGVSANTLTITGNLLSGSTGQIVINVVGRVNRFLTSGESYSFVGGFFTGAVSSCPFVYTDTVNAVTAASMTKTAVAPRAGNSAISGDTVTFTIRYQNIGTTPIAGFLRDVLSPNLTLISPTTFGVNSNQRLLDNGAGGSILSPGEQGTLTITARVNTNIRGASTITNNASIVNLTNQTIASSNSVSINSIADLSIRKERVGPLVQIPGDTTQYRIIVTNNGSAPSGTYRLNDVRPLSQLNIVFAGGMTPVAGGFFINGGSLGVGQSNTYLVNGTMNTALNSGTTLPNTVSLSNFSAPDAQSSNDSASINGLVGPSSVGIDVQYLGTTPLPGPAMAGDQVGYRVTVTNQGRRQLPSNTQINLTLPTSINYLTASLAPSNLASLQRQTPVALAPNGSYSFIMTGRLNTSPTIGTRLPVTGTLIAPINFILNPASDNDFATVVTGMRLGLTKTADRSTAMSGDIITYTIRYTNLGNVSMYLSLIDNRPDSILEFLPAQSTAGLEKDGTQIKRGFAGAQQVGFGGSGTITIAGRVRNNSVSQILNSATMSYNQVGPVNNNFIPAGSTGASVTVAGNSNLIITKVRTSPNPVVGSANPVTFRITITNAGNSASSGLFLRDTLNPNLTVQSRSIAPTVSNSGVFNNQFYRTNLANIPAGGQIIIDLNARLNQTVNAGESCDNTVQFSNSSLSNFFTGATASCIVEGRPDNRITKTIQSGSVIRSGDIIRFTISYGNSGSWTNTGLTITDTLPAGFVYVGNQTPTNLNPILSNNSGTITRTGIANPVNGATANGTISFDARLRQDFVGGTVFTNTATISSVASESNTLNNTTTATGLILGEARTSILKQFAGSQREFKVGDIVTFNLTIDNTRGTRATRVNLTDQLPSYLSYVSTSPVSGSVNSSNIASRSGISVGTGTSTVITLTTRVNSGTVAQSSLGTDFINTANITNVDTPSIILTGTSSVTGQILPTPGLSIVKSGNTDRIVSGQQMTFTITVTNTGNVPLDVKIEDQLPSQLTFVPGSSTPGAIVSVNNIIDWYRDFGDLVLQPGQSRTINLVAIANTNAFNTLTNIATAKYKISAIDIPFNTAQSSFQVFGESNLRINKTRLELNPSNSGDFVGYQITVTNIGSAIASGLVIYDQLPECINYYSASLQPQNASLILGPSYGRDIFWSNVGPIAPNGGTLTITMTGRLAQLAPANPACSIGTILTNTAEVRRTVASAPIEVSTATGMIVGVLPDISVSKSLTGRAPSRSGDLVSFAITLNNLSPIDIAPGSITVTDILPVGLTYMSSTLNGVTLTTSGGRITSAQGTVGQGLSSGQSLIVYLTGQMTSGYTVGTTFVNTVFAQASTEEQLSQNTGTASFAIIPITTNVDVTKRVLTGGQYAGTQVRSGSIVGFEVTVTNTGITTADVSTLREVRPAQLTGFSASLPFTRNPSDGSYTFTLNNLQPNETRTIIISGVVQASSFSSIINTAEARDPANMLLDSASVTLGSISDVQITKTMTSPMPSLDTDQIVYRVDVTNIGSSTATGIVVTDDFPSSILDIVSITPSEFGSLTTTIPSLAAGETRTYTITANLKPGMLVMGTSFTNTGRIVSVGSVEASTGNNLSVVTGSVVGLPDLSVTKRTLGPIPSRPGDAVGFEIIISNSGTAQINNVIVTDILPSALSFGSASSTTDSIPTPSASGNRVTRTGITLSTGGTVGNSATIIFTGLLTTGGTLPGGLRLSGTIYTNTVSISSSGAQREFTTTNNTGSSTGVIYELQTTDIQVSKTITRNPTLIDTGMVFVVRIFNSGNSTATGIQLTDVITSQIQYLTSSIAPTNPAVGNLVFLIPDLPAGSGINLIITGQIAPGVAVGTTGINTATGTTDSFEFFTGNNAGSAGWRVISTGADLDITKRLVSINPSNSGDIVTYQLIVSNTGLSASSTFDITDILPSQLTAVSATPAWTSIDGSTVTRSGLSALAPGQSTIITLNTRLNSNYPVTTSFTNTAIATLSGEDFTGNNTATATGQVILIPRTDLEIRKSYNPAASIVTNSGDTLQYQLTLINSGTTDLTGIVLTDIFPSILRPGTATLPYSLNGNTLTWTGIALNAGQSLVVTIDATLRSQQSTGTSFSNTATITSFSGETNTTNNTAILSGQVGIRPSSDLRMIKTYLGGENNISPTRAGDRVRFALNITNIGQSTATGIIVSDIFGSQLAPVSVALDGGNAITPTINGNLIQRSASDLLAGQSVRYIVTLQLNADYPNNTVFTNTGAVSTLSAEQSLTNNTGAAQGTISIRSQLSIRKTILPSGTKQGQFASGDIVGFRLDYTNTGTAIVNNISIIDTLPSFMTLVGGSTTRSIGTLTPGQSGFVTLSGQITRNGFGVGTNTACINSPTTSQVCDTATINEQPSICGDNRVSGNETCDLINGATRDINGNILGLGQSCNACQIRTDYIVNTVIMDFIFQNIDYRTTGNVPVYLTGAAPSACQYLTTDLPTSYTVSGSTNVNINKPFTCKAAQYTPNQTAVRLDCRNGQVFNGTVDANGNYTATCNYTSVGNYDAQCTIGTEVSVNPQCTQRIAIGTSQPNICGDGIVESNNIFNPEQCDLGTPDGQVIGAVIGTGRDGRPIQATSDQRGKTCRQCRIEGSPKIASPACALSDSPISVQTGEYVPFRRDIDLADSSKTVTSESACSDPSNEGKVIVQSLQCRFEVFNGKNEPETVNNVSQNGRNPFGGFRPCGIDNRMNGGSTVAPLFEYFSRNYFNDPEYLLMRPGRDFFKLTDASLINGNLGEYKLSLEEVKYSYCRNGQVAEGIPYPRVCQTNFSVTRPYLMQRGATSSASNDELSDFYDLFGSNLSSANDLTRLSKISLSSYDGGTAVSDLTSKFVDKYSTLAQTIDLNNAGISIFNGSTISSTNLNVKKVPGKAIRVFNLASTESLIVDEKFQQSGPFTIIVQQGNLIVRGDVKSNGLFIVPNGTIRFDDNNNGCTPDGVDAGMNQSLTTRNGKHERQVVNGIFITNKGFEGESKSNTDLSKSRCQEGGLTIKGVVIGPNLQNLVNSKRSELNDWFSPHVNLTPDQIKQKRRQMLYEGAAVLIEHNANLWDNLPPGADELQSSLEVYKR